MKYITLALLVSFIVQVVSIVCMKIPACGEWAYSLHTWNGFLMIALVLAHAFKNRRGLVNLFKWGKR